MSKVKLCVNIDHIATLREARGGVEPDLIAGAKICENAGAYGITIHLREDRRHIQDKDVFELKKIVQGKFNLEMALSDDIISIAKKIIPHQITLVPEKREELTTEGGLDVKNNFDKIKLLVEEFKALNVLVSLFIEPDAEVIKLASDTGAEYIEIHTGSYSNATGADIEKELKRIYDAAEYGVKLGLKINAGHGLNYENTQAILKLPELEELNTGHSIISRSIFTGLEKAVTDMVELIKS